MKRFIKWFLISVVLVIVILDVIFISIPLKGQIPVLLYHVIVPESGITNDSLHVNNESFKKHMWFLKTFGFKPISLEKLYKIKTGQKTPEGRQIVITFDGGDRSYAEHALPILEEFEIPSANFLITKHVENELRGSMDLQTVKKLMLNPLVTLGSHTNTHPNIASLDLRNAKIEVMQSKGDLEQLIGSRVDYFSFPMGSFDDKSIEMVRRAGYKLGFTTDWNKLEGRPETIYALDRTKVNGNENWFTFWFKVSGLDSEWTKLRISLGKLIRRN